MIVDGLKWMFLIIGTTIGAGYASGREIWQFFGYESGLAIVLFTILFVISCHVVLSISYRHQTSDYAEVLVEILGPRLSKGYDAIIIFYLFTMTGVMIAGGGAALEYFQIPFMGGIVFMCTLLLIIAIRGINGLTSINSLLMPVLIISLAFVLFSFYTLHVDADAVNWQNQRNWPAAFMFTSLNLLPLVAVLGATGRKIKRPGEIWVASVGSGLILGTVSLLYNESLLVAAEDIMLYEIPLFALLESFPRHMTTFMAVLLWTAIFTTAASGLFGLTSRFRSIIALPPWSLALLLLCLMLPVTQFGFSSLIAFLYPLYGFLNLYLLIMVLIHPLYLRKKNS
ncbi:GerAB/ArcD/ProY family transporter [Bacillus piscicola]|uniref:YkvI family membrane protein n=1 Tax=Bacillus piscicola TaxID=1632684 RepID=UPI001F094D72|nr:GerAB/ArcD/ProY family transporter [Bacillus piscicola]